jgi:hypothetical protein
MDTAPYAAAEVVSNNGRISDVLRAKGGRVVWVRVDIACAFYENSEGPDEEQLETGPRS